MASVVTKKCPNCGAGLQLNPDAGQPYNLTCGFCRNTIAVYPHVKAPPGHPPVPRPAGPNVIVMEPNAGAAAGKTVGCIIATAALLPALIALFGALGGPCVGYLNGRFSPWYFPAKCESNEEIVVHGRKESRTDTFITGGSNCKIRLVDCDLTGPIIFKGGSNSEVVLEHTTIHVTKAVLDGDSNSKVVLTDGSKVFSEGVVATGDSNLEVDVSGSSIDAKGAIVRVQIHGKVSAKEKSRIHAGKALVDGTFGDISFDDSTLTLGDTALRDGAQHTKVKVAGGSKVSGPRVPFAGGDYVDIAIDGSQVEGGTGVIDLGQHSSVNVRDNATVTAKAGDAIRMGEHSQVDVGAGSLVQAPKTAVRFRAYGTLRVNGGRIRGSDAIYGENYTRVTLRRATVEGRRTTGDYSKVEEE